MFNRRTLAVIKRELREKLLSKSFILMTLLIPVFMFGILGFQTWMMTYEGDSGSKLEIISGNDEINENIQKEFKDADFVKDRSYSIKYKVVKQDELQSYLKDKKKEILNEKLTGVVYVPETALRDKKIEYYASSPNNNTIFTKLRTPVNKALVNMYFKDKNIQFSDISFASEGVDFTGFRVSRDKNIEEEGFGNLAVSYIFSFLLYFSLLFTGTIMMRSVVQEKNNRIVELLLSSVDSSELMTGKILGTSVTGVIQMAIWLSPIIVLASSSIFMLPPELLMKISLMQILYFLINYFIGMITFMGLFATVGAIFDNEQDAQSGLWPIMILIMVPFFITFTLVNNPDNIIAKIASLFPFSSIMVMPARMTLVDLPAWELALSAAINIATMVLIFLAAGKIYRIGILMTGKKPKWSEVARWVRYKY